MIDILEFDLAISSAEEWIADLKARLGWQDREKVYLALIAVLHGLRDCVPADEATYVGQSFPPLLRGLYYEGWHPRRRRIAVRDRDEFLNRIHDGVHHDPGIDPENVAQVVFGLLAQRLPASEVEDVRAVTPKPLRSLWPN